MSSCLRGHWDCRSTHGRVRAASKGPESPSSESTLCGCARWAGEPSVCGVDPALGRKGPGRGLCFPGEGGASRHIKTNATANVWTHLTEPWVPTYLVKRYSGCFWMRLTLESVD